jgi:fatty acid desaturase
VGEDLQTTETGQPAPRRIPDPLTLLAGLAALAVAVTALVGSTSWLPSVDLRWVFAGGAATVGVLLLVGPLRSER